MKRAMPWIDKEDDSSSDDSSASESDTAEIKPKGQSKAPEGIDPFSDYLLANFIAKSMC